MSLNILPDASILVFVFAWALAFFFPGDNSLKLLGLNFFPRLILSTILGIALWALQGYVFGWFGVRWLTYFYILVNFLIWVKFNSPFRLKLPAFNLKKIDWSVPLIIIGGSLFNLTAVWFMGTSQDGGILFCCRGVPDAIYHLALTNQVIKNFPPFEPGDADLILKNYHFLSNLVVADLSRVFKIEVSTLHFRYMSILIALLLGSSAFVFAGILKLKVVFAKWLALFLYASGDILYILLFLRRDGLNFDVTIFDDATKLLAGPPRAFSIVLFFGGICLLSIWIKQKKWFAGYLGAIVLGSLIGFKVYTGIFALVGLGFLGVYFLAKKHFLHIFPLIVALTISILLYFPTNSGAGGLKFNGLWRFENFAAHENLKIGGLELLRLQAISEKIWLVPFYEILFIALYFTFLFGTVNFALFQTKKSLSLFPRELNILLISGLIVTVLVGSFFLQETGGANTVQFLIGAFIIGGIYSSLAIYHWFNNFPKILVVIAAFIIIVLTSSRSVHEVYGNLVSLFKKNDFVVTKEEMAGLLYLRNNTPGDSKVMLVDVMSEHQIYIYVSYLSDRPMYLVGAGLLRDHGFDTSKKQELLKKIQHTSNPADLKTILTSNSVDYIFSHHELPDSIARNPDAFNRVYTNEKVNVFKVN